MKRIIHSVTALSRLGIADRTLEPSRQCSFASDGADGTKNSSCQRRIAAEHADRTQNPSNQRSLPTRRHQNKNAPVAGGARSPGASDGNRRVAFGNAQRLRATRSARQRPLDAAALAGSIPYDVTKTKTPPWLGALAHLEPVMGIEPITTGLQGRCSTIEPHWRGMPIVPPSRRSSLPWREKTWSQLATACKHATGPAASRASRAPQDSAGPPASCANGSAPRAQPRRRVPRSRCRSPEAGSICSSPARRPP